nr:hypothetical protein [Chitinimonas koreensis]
MPAIEPDQFRIAAEIGGPVQVGILIARIEYPQQMGIEEGSDRRMRIFHRIGMDMMPAMNVRPPERPAESACCAEQGQDELEDAGGFIAAMGEITMQSAFDAETANQEARRGQYE